MTRGGRHIVTIDSQGFFVRDRGELSTHEACESPGHGSYDARGHETRGSRAMRVSLARAFPVRIAPLREALVSGSITKLARP